MTYRTAPVEVLVVATHGHVAGINADDGTTIWQHARGDAWPFGGSVPRIGRVDADVVVACGDEHVVWLRVGDGAVLGRDKLWFHIDHLVARAPYLVVRGALGMACYRSGTRAWGIRFVTAPGAILDPGKPWLTDAAGNPLRPADGFGLGSAAMLLGDAVTQIDRTT
jgi:hypothetical protein